MSTTLTADLTVDADLELFKQAVLSGTYRRQPKRRLPLWVIGDRLLVAEVHVDPLFVRTRRDAGRVDERAQARAELRVYPKPESGYISDFDPKGVPFWPYHSFDVIKGDAGRLGYAFRPENLCTIGTVREWEEDQMIYDLFDLFEERLDPEQMTFEVGVRGARKLFAMLTIAELNDRPVYGPEHIARHLPKLFS